jgi:hypothetical protein
MAGPYRSPRGPAQSDYGPPSTWTAPARLDDAPAAGRHPGGFRGGGRRLAAEQGIWTWPQAMVTPDPGVQRVELYVGDATRAVPPGKVRDIVLALTGS